MGLYVALLWHKMASVMDGLLQADILLTRKLKTGTSTCWSLMAEKQKFRMKLM